MNLSLLTFIGRALNILRCNGVPENKIEFDFKFERKVGQFSLDIFGDKFDSHFLIMSHGHVEYHIQFQDVSATETSDIFIQLKVRNDEEADSAFDDFILKRMQGNK